MNTSGEYGRSVACKGMMSVLGLSFVGLFMAAQNPKGIRTCTRTAGKGGWSVNYGDPSFALEMK